MRKIFFFFSAVPWQTIPLYTQEQQYHRDTGERYGAKPADTQTSLLALWLLRLTPDQGDRTWYGNLKVEDPGG